MQKILLFTVKIAIAILAIFFLTQNGLLSLPLIKSTLISPHILPIFLLIFVVILINTIRWFALLKSQKINIKFIRCFNLYYTSFAFNYILPGGITGDAIKIGNIVQYSSNKKSIAGLSVVIDRLLSLISCLLIILFFVPQIFVKINPTKWHFMSSHEFIITYYISLIFLVFSSLFLTLFLLGNKRLYQKLIKLFHRKKNLIYRSLYIITKTIFAYRKSKLVLGSNIIIACAAQIIIALGLFLISKNILPEQNANLSDYTFASIFAQIVSIIPISPGGIGVGEVAFAKILYYLNNKILLEYASVFLTFRIISMIFSIPGIAMFVFSKKINK